MFGLATQNDAFNSASPHHSYWVMEGATENYAEMKSVKEELIVVLRKKAQL